MALSGILEVMQSNPTCIAKIVTMISVNMRHAQFGGVAMSDELKPTKVTCIKPNDPPMRVIRDTSEGIEPIFQRRYQRVLDWTELELLGSNKRRAENEKR